MRSFVFILSFYILALVVLPCGCAEVCIENEQVECSLGGKEIPHHNDELPCQPFCTDYCCVTVIQVSEVQDTYTVPFTFIRTLYTLFSFNEILGDIYGFWNPPKW